MKRLNEMIVSHGHSFDLVEGERLDECCARCFERLSDPYEKNGMLHFRDEEAKVEYSFQTKDRDYVFGRRAEVALFAAIREFFEDELYSGLTVGSGMVDFSEVGNQIRAHTPNDLNGVKTSARRIVVNLCLMGIERETKEKSQWKS